MRYIFISEFIKIVRYIIFIRQKGIKSVPENALD